MTAAASAPAIDPELADLVASVYPPPALRYGPNPAQIWREQQDDGDEVLLVALTRDVYGLVDRRLWEAGLCRFHWRAKSVCLKGRTERWAMLANLRREPGHPRRQVYAHRLIGALLGWGVETTVDHREHPELEDGADAVIDNRVANLRPLTGDSPASLNSANARFRIGQAGYRGVWLSRKRYMACITVNRHRYYLGMFDTPKEAAEAYDSAAIKAFGSFARLNFPSPQRTIPF